MLGSWGDLELLQVLLRIFGCFEPESHVGSLNSYLESSLIWSWFGIKCSVYAVSVLLCRSRVARSAVATEFGSKPLEFYTLVLCVVLWFWLQICVLRIWKCSVSLLWGFEAENFIPSEISEYPEYSFPPGVVFLCGNVAYNVIDYFKVICRMAELKVWMIWTY